MENISITIWLTHKCNMNCIYCYEGKKNPISMNIDVAKNTYIYIKKTLYDNKIKKCLVHFHGGEPFLKNNLITYFLEEFSMIKDTRFFYSVTTNGTLLDNEILCNMLKFNEINISIDGNKELQESNRPLLSGRNSSVILKENIDCIMNHDIKFNARMTVIPSDINKLEKNIEYLYNLGIRNIICVIDYWNYDWHVNELKKYLSEIDKFKRKFSSDDKLKIYDIMASTDSFKGKCSGGITNRIIDCDGSLYPCTVLCGNNAYKIGSIYDDINVDWNAKLQVFNSDIENMCIICNKNKKCAARRCVFMKKTNYNLFSNLCTIQKMN